MLASYFFTNFSILVIHLFSNKWEVNGYASRLGNIVLFMLVSCSFRDKEDIDD